MLKCFSLLFITSLTINFANVNADNTPPANFTWDPAFKKGIEKVLSPVKQPSVKRGSILFVKMLQKDFKEKNRPFNVRKSFWAKKGVLN